MHTRSILLATVAAIALAAPDRARAQAVVIDPANIAQSISMVRGITQQVQQAVQQYQMLQRTYSAISGARDVGGIAMALGGVARTYLPEASGMLQGIAQGSRILNGATSYRNADSLLSQIPQALQGMRTAEGWMEEMERRQISTANAKMIAEQGLFDVEDRIARLRQAELRLSMAVDATDIAAVNGLIAISGQNLAAHDASINSIRLALHAEDRAERQRDEQRQVQGAAEWMNNTQWAVDALGR